MKRKLHCILAVSLLVCSVACKNPWSKEKPLTLTGITAVMQSGITDFDEMHIPWSQIKEVKFISFINSGIHLYFNYKLKYGRTRERLTTWVLPHKFLIVNDVPTGDKKSTKELYECIIDTWNKNN